MFWTKDHDVILCREVLVANPYEFKKSSTQRSQVWEQIADILNKCSSPTFNVDKRSVRDHVGILQNRQKKKVRAEERATGIAPDEPSELDNLLEQIISLEESTESDDKAKADKAKAEDVRMKAMEKLSQTKKRELAEGGDSKRKRQRRSGGDAMALLTERAERNYEIREKELGLKREKQEMERKQLEVTAQQKLQLKQQQADMMKLMQQQQQYQQQQMLLMQQQQQQAASLIGLLNKLLNK